MAPRAATNQRPNILYGVNAVVMHYGRIEQIGTPLELYDNPSCALQDWSILSVSTGKRLRFHDDRPDRYFRSASGPLTCGLPVS